MAETPSWIELMGRHAASGTHGLTATVTTRGDGEPTQWQVWRSRSDHWRIEQGGDPVYLFDGRSAVMRRDGRMHRSQSDFHMPLLGSPGPMAFVGGQSLLERMSQNIVPSQPRLVSEGGRRAYAVDLTRDGGSEVAEVVLDDETGVLLRFTADAVDRLVVTDLQLRGDLPDELFVWGGPAEETPRPDRGEARRRAREVPWIAVLVQMVHGPNPPVRGKIRSVGEDGTAESFGRNVAIGPVGDLSVWRDGARVRIERPDGTPVLISDGTRSWRFRGRDVPVQEPVDPLMFQGSGTELLVRRPAAEWVGDDFTQLIGTVEMTRRLGRSVYEFDLAPPAHKPHPLHMVVDAETGLVLLQGVPSNGSVDEWTEFEILDSLDDELFTWSGPSQSAEELVRRQREEGESARREHLTWFRDNVTAEPLTVETTITLEVTHVHEVDSETGTFSASLGDHRYSGSLSRRVHSEYVWAPYPDARTWSSNGFDWVLAVRGVELSDSAFADLRRRIDPSTS